MSNLLLMTYVTKCFTMQGHSRWSGWSGLKFLAQGNTTTRDASHSSIIQLLLKETTTTNSTIRELNQDLLDHRLIPNHCCCYPTS